VHHITMGSFRIPSWMGFLGLPFIFGPVGGGEEAAPSLVKNLPLKFRIKELVRSLANKLAVWNPLMFLTFRSSSLIYCKTQETARLIPHIFQHKVRVFMEIGIHEDDLMLVEPIVERNTETLNILFVGRLIYWKGAHLVLKSVASLADQGYKVRLTIVGEGAESSWIKDLARRLGIYEQTDWISSIAQNELFRLYSSYDLMLFPSLHDSSGNVVLESLAHGLPVLCLDLGGPKELVDESCGAVIPTKGRDEEACVRAISEKIEHWIKHPEELAAKKSGCIPIAAQRSWASVSQQNLQIIEEHLAIA
ncbi:MAG: glycosyltransferase, partial [Bacteroidota bacterium]